ncbi:MAG: hypothetical protein HC802_22305 [Caldilineaceae bacterium]|nr:hypothetical protein [Caldilineaceae bacterium]
MDRSLHWSSKRQRVFCRRSTARSSSAPRSTISTSRHSTRRSRGTYLHDGQATTLTEAILFHGGEAQWTQSGFSALDEREQAAIIAFLNNLVLFKAE